MIVNKPKKKKHMSRYTVMSIILGAILGIMVLRLLYLQVFCYEDYKERANTTSTKFVSEIAPRGEILDCNGLLLATNKRTYSLTYTETKEVREKFYTTMEELFKILDECGESIQDNMLLKLKDDGSMYYAFKTTTEEGHNYEELRFKKDRGLEEKIKNKLYPKVTELTPEQSEIVDKELLKITPEELFYELVKSYDLVSLVEPNYKNDKKKNASYSKMSGEELTQKILDSGYSLQYIKRLMVVKDIMKIQNLKNNKTITIVSNVSKDTVLIIKQRLTDLPGIDVLSVPIRDYPYKELGSAVLGYVSSIDNSEKNQYTLRGYDSSTDLVGKVGIEAAFEDQLKGVKGGTTVKVNSSGRVTEKLFQLESCTGNNVNLTIDAGLQWAAEHALKDTIDEIREHKSDNYGHTYKNATRGALIAVEVNTGRILSLVSYPNYDPNLFTIPGTLSEEENNKYFSPDYNKFGKELIQKLNLNTTVDKLFEDGKDGNDLYAMPFYNYATMSLIPPGSTFKPLTGIAGIESGAMSVDTIVHTTGKFDSHKELYNSSNAPTCLGLSRGGHGSINVEGALEVSCNIYFYETAYQMYHKALDEGKSKEEALDCIAEYAWQFGLGADPNVENANVSTGIEIKENFGQVYNFTSYRRRAAESSKYDLVKFLEEGDYDGRGIMFVPFDIKVNDDDIEQVKNSKAKIKELVTDALSTVGTKTVDKDEFEKSIKNEVKNIMEQSDVYKARVAEYEKNTKKTVNLEKELNQITTAISRFTLSDQAASILTPGQLISASIGQSSSTFTPLQLAAYVSTIANGGTRYKLHLVDKVTDTNGKVIQQYDKQVLNTIDIKDSTLAAIKNGMSKVNNDENGTAMSAFKGFPESIGTAGKTGSADFRDDQYEKGRAPYATYISFAPIDNPEIAVVAVVFDGGHGGFAAPAVRGVYDYYFRDRIIKENPNYAQTSEYYKKYVLNNEILNKDSDKSEDESKDKENISKDDDDKNISDNKNKKVKNNN